MRAYGVERHIFIASVQLRWNCIQHVSVLASPTGEGTGLSKYTAYVLSPSGLCAVRICAVVSWDTAVPAERPFPFAKSAEDPHSHLAVMSATRRTEYDDPRRSSYVDRSRTVRIHHHGTGSRCVHFSPSSASLFYFFDAHVEHRSDAGLRYSSWDAPCVRGGDSESNMENNTVQPSCHPARRELALHVYMAHERQRDGVVRRLEPVLGRLRTSQTSCWKHAQLCSTRGGRVS